MEYTHKVICNKCNKEFKLIYLKQESNFAFIYRQENGKLFKGKSCNECRCKYQRDIWPNGRKKASIQNYEKSPQGFLMRLYRNMKSRINGVQKQKKHLYAGKYLLPKEQFYEWAKNNQKFAELYATYVASGYERKLAPSVDRIDSEKGYEIDNMEFVTMSENSRRGSMSAKLKLKSKVQK